VVHLERIATPDGVLPAPLDPPPAGVEARPEAASEAMFDPAESARLDAEAVA
jgi:hypothetical protein